MPQVSEAYRPWPLELTLDAEYRLVTSANYTFEQGALMEK